MQVLSVTLRLSHGVKTAYWPPGSCRTLPAESSKPQRLWPRAAAAVVLRECSRPRSVFPSSGCGLVGAPGEAGPHTPRVPSPPFPGKCLHSRHSLSPQGSSRLCIFHIAERDLGGQGAPAGSLLPSQPFSGQRARPEDASHTWVSPERPFGAAPWPAPSMGPPTMDHGTGQQAGNRRVC